MVVSPRKRMYSHTLTSIDSAVPKKTKGKKKKETGTGKETPKPKRNSQPVITPLIEGRNNRKIRRELSYLLDSGRKEQRELSGTPAVGNAEGRPTLTTRAVHQKEENKEE